MPALMWIDQVTAQNHIKFTSLPDQNNHTSTWVEDGDIWIKGDQTWVGGDSESERGKESTDQLMMLPLNGLCVASWRFSDFKLCLKLISLNIFSDN